jgi:SAM-dependent methyltransferase
LKILLPGSDQQIRFLLDSVDVENKSILIIGSGSVPVADAFNEAGAGIVEIIVDDYESFINSSLLLKDKSDLVIKIMDYANTDFKKGSFDIIYAQGSLSASGRKETVKEIKRLLKTGGVLCNGEIVKLEKKVPAYIEDIFESSGIDPLTLSELKKYFTDRNFKVVLKKDLSFTLKKYYSTSIINLESAVEDLTKREKSYHKKLIKQIKHQAAAYLKHGADKFIGFYLFIMEKI